MKHRHRRMILSFLVAVLVSVLIVPEIPAQVIAVPRSTTTTAPKVYLPPGTAPPVTAPTILPNITGYTPPNGGMVGGTITFNGLNLVGSYFFAKIGGTPLTITSRSATQIVATLPAVRMAGDLTVGYSNLPSPIVLKAGYRVIGPPVISGVQPASFRRGDIVTVTGMDVDGLTWLPKAGYAMGYVRLGAKEDGTLTKDYLSISSWKAAPDGTQVTFQVFDVYEYIAWIVPATSTQPTQWLHDIVPLNPQPSSLSGPLRFIKDSGLWSIVGPPVTWSPAVLTFSTLDPPLWGSQKVDFVVTNSPTTSPTLGGALYGTNVSFTGSNLNGATISMGGKEQLAKGISASGADGWFMPAYGTTSDYVTFSKGGNSVRSTNVLKIISGPRMQDASTAPITLPLNTDITITGWDLLTTSVPGMTYEFRMQNSSFAPCNLSMQVVSHTLNQIKYRINTTGTIPQGCLSSTSMFYQTGTNTSSVSAKSMQLLLKYGGVEREYWRRPYLLLAP